jgi:hypothetical protein
MLSRNVLLYGKEEPLPRRIPLRAGPLTMVWEEGGLRYLSCRGYPVLHGVYVAVRDTTWDTIPPVCSDVHLEQGDEAFIMTFSVRHQRNEIDFCWRGAIRGNADGSVTFTMDGEAHGTFLINRIGFCVLHPALCAGQPCIVEGVDGTRREGLFPRHIAPHQPFMGMRSITHQPVPGLRASTRMTGETYEMEDQRNWTDASFKTYCPPLGEPYPRRVTVGQRVRQAVSLSLQGTLPATARPAPSATTTVTVESKPVASLPKLGLGLASHGQPLSETELDRLRKLRLHHLRVELALSDSGGPAELRRAAAEAVSLGLPLEVALLTSEGSEAELRALAEVVAEVRPRVWAWQILSQEDVGVSQELIATARRVLCDLAPDAGVGSGSHTNFTELNRHRPPLDGLDLVCYALNPQVHAFDNASVMETLPMQALTVANARRFCDRLPLVVGPITLRMRTGTGPGELQRAREQSRLPGAVDPRQMSLFGAAWTVASLKYLGESGVCAATYYETSGWLGVQEAPRGSPFGDLFPSLAGSVYLLYHVLADLGEFVDGRILASSSDPPDRALSLALANGGRTSVLLANLTPEPQQVAVRGLGPRVWLRRLNAACAERAMREPIAYRREREDVATEDGALSLRLDAYAVARVGWGDEGA